MKEILERLECLKRVIDGAFVNGKIDFDAIVGELDSISSELQLQWQTGEALRQNPKKSTVIHSIIDPIDFS